MGDPSPWFPLTTGSALPHRRVGEVGQLGGRRLHLRRTQQGVHGAIGHRVPPGATGGHPTTDLSATRPLRTKQNELMGQESRGCGY